jgi:kynureninase
VPATREECVERDRADSLAPWRDRFLLPPDVVYLDGNSLGALPRSTGPRLARMVEQEWGDGLIRSWNDAGWFPAAGRVGDKIARLIGARTGEVVVADSTSVNLHKLVSAAMAARPGRRVVLSQRGNFPTDLYVASAVPGAELVTVEAADIAGRLDSSVALLMLTHVDYITAAVHDMRGLTARAHESGALSLWDLCHSAGALPLDVDACGVDLAVGCGYKYLNGGPGAPAFLYVRRSLQNSLTQPLTGWFGHAEPFAFEPGYRRAEGIAHFLSGTPPMLSLGALETAVDLWLEVGDLDAVRAKSMALGELFVELVDERCAGLGLELLSPRDRGERGSHVSYRYPQAYAVMCALLERAVVGDVRAGEVLRFGFAPLYVRFADVWDAVEQLRDVLVGETWHAHASVPRRAVM